MGADGGLEWLRLRSHIPNCKQRVLQLLTPLYILNTNFRNEDAVWLQNNTLPYQDDEIIISRYGTDLPFSLYNLHEFLLYYDDDEYEYDWSEYTFFELIEDILTRPNYLLFNLSNLENIIIYYYLYDVKLLSIDSLIPIGSIKIIDWIRELKKLLYVNSYGSVETWT